MNRLPIIVLFFFLLISSRGSIFAQDILHPLDPYWGSHTDEIDDNCAIPLDGQEFHDSGGEGGIVFDADLVPIDSNFILSMIADIPPNYGEKPVVILIVDDFTNGDLPQDILIDSEQTDLNIQHGAMVLQHTDRLLDVLKNALDKELRIKIVEVNIGDTENGFETSQIASQIDKVIEGLSDDYRDANIVVNMSFNLLPCTVANDFRDFKEDDPQYSFEEYVNDVVLAQHPTINNLSSWISSKLAQVALDTNLQNIDTGADNTVFVAAAGNFGDKFSYILFPGAWSGILSVSGAEYNEELIEDDDDTGWIRWNHSNNGEVLAPAAWYQYITPSGVQTDARYAGTSFAAPVISVISALYLTAENPACPFSLTSSLYATHAYDQNFETLRSLLNC